MTLPLYAIGDIQGCWQELVALLARIPPPDPLVFVGDLVNRGPRSLDCLRLIKGLCESGRARTVLGNHDLHLLAVAAGAGQVHRRDTISDILAAPDRAELVDWLRRQPLVIDEPEVLFVHAGVPPRWDLSQTLALAEEAHQALAGPGWRDYLRGMYGDDGLALASSGPARMRSILNALTRIRLLDAEGQPHYEFKLDLRRAPAGFRPWYEFPGLIDKTICFGHWSVLGLMIRPRRVAIDTGCLWGGALTALRWPDRRVLQEPCRDALAPVPCVTA